MEAPKIGTESNVVFLVKRIYLSVVDVGIFLLNAGADSHDLQFTVRENLLLHLS